MSVAISHKRRLIGEEFEVLGSDSDIVFSGGNGHGSRQSNFVQTWTNRRTFRCSVHTSIPLRGLLVQIIDTPQFQRLRSIKQLSSLCLVYPTATHTRFEHCIGTCYLATLLLDSIKKQLHEDSEFQPVSLTSSEPGEKRRGVDYVTDVDELCVQIAALCHDLGHGPLSHLFDLMFIPSVCPDSTWKHEQASVAMFRHLLNSNPNVRKSLTDFGLVERDFIFIEELIVGPACNFDGKRLQITADRWPYKGRDVDKSFLFEIVSNQATGADVDKFDYILRDSMALGIKVCFCPQRFIQNARVMWCPDDKLYHICQPNKDFCTIDEELFQSRARLHKLAYQHKTVLAIELMITDALVYANNFITIPGTDDNLLKMSECINDMTAYAQLDDSILDRILKPHIPVAQLPPNLRKAQQLLRNITERRLYKYLGETLENRTDLVIHNSGINNAILAQILAYQSQVNNLSSTNSTKIDPVVVLIPSDAIVLVSQIDFGMKAQCPIEHMYFYDKYSNRPFKLRKENISRILPASNFEQRIRLYCRSNDSAKHVLLSECFKLFCLVEGLGEPDRGNNAFTPVKSRQESISNGQA